MAPAATTERARPRARRRTAHWRPLLSIVGFLSGAMIGLSVLVLLHQNGSIYPTRNLALAMVLGGALVFGIVVPSLVRALAVRRANARRSARHG